MRLEPPDADLRGRRSPLTSIDDTPTPAPAPLAALVGPAVAAVAGCGAVIALALSSTGLLTVAALAFGAAMWRPAAGLAALLAVASVAVRWGVHDFADLAGVQSVLGPAGTVGTTIQALSAWAAAIAISTSARGLPISLGSPLGSEPDLHLDPDERSTTDLVAVAPGPVWRDAAAIGGQRTHGVIASLAPALAAGTFAAAVVAGPGPGDRVVVRIGATIVATAVAALVVRVARSTSVDRALTVVSVLAAVFAVLVAAAPT